MIFAVYLNVDIVISVPHICSNNYKILSPVCSNNYKTIILNSVRFLCLYMSASSENFFACAQYNLEKQ